MTTADAWSGAELPRELLPGVFWLGQCRSIGTGDRTLHSYNSVYVVAGEDASVVVEGGAPFELEAVETQVDQLLDDGLSPIKYVFITHPETNHSSGLGQFLERFPDASLIGDPTDLHLNFPQHCDRISDRPPRTPLDLGGRQFLWVASIFHDLPSTRWGFDTASRSLFAGDGFAFAHYHQAGHCAHTAEESVAKTDSLDVAAETGLFLEAAFYWARFIDIEYYIDRLDALIEELDVQLIAPTHGLPIGDLSAILPGIREGLRIGAARTDVEFR